jgi:DnaJ like chaperone protein
MSSSEILVILFGLFLGYWVISKLMATKQSEPENIEPPKEYNRFKGDFDSKNTDYDEWYVVLGVNRGATSEEIRAAYKTLISQYHPDKVSGLGEDLRDLAEKKSKAINVAYQKAQDIRGGKP